MDGTARLCDRRRTTPCIAPRKWAVIVLKLPRKSLKTKPSRTTLYEHRETPVGAGGLSLFRSANSRYFLTGRCVSALRVSLNLVLSAGAVQPYAGFVDGFCRGPKMFTRAPHELRGISLTQISAARILKFRDALFLKAIAVFYFWRPNCCCVM